METLRSEWLIPRSDWSQRDSQMERERERERGGYIPPSRIDKARFPLASLLTTLSRNLDYYSDHFDLLACYCPLSLSWGPGLLTNISLYQLKASHISLTTTECLKLLNIPLFRTIRFLCSPFPLSPISLNSRCLVQLVPQSFNTFRSIAKEPKQKDFFCFRFL